MEQRSMIRFFTLKVPNARAIHTERNSVYGREASALPTVKKWWGRFHQGKTDLFDDLGPGRPLPNDHARAMTLVSEKTNVDFVLLQILAD
jgi:hypothetical protein